MTRLTKADIEPAIVGGMLLSAGGSGRSRVAQTRHFGESACVRGAINLTPASGLDAQTDIIIATAVGAPGGGKHLAEPEHSVLAARQLLKASGTVAGAVIPGHVPGIYAWLMAAELGIPLLDAACNGRGHPTVNMGSLGLSSQPEVRFFQAGVSAKLRITVYGNTLVTSQMMRNAAVQSDGLIMACRGPFKLELVNSAGALGAISYQLGLGRAVLDAASGGAKLEAALGFSKGRVLALGNVVGNTVAYKDGFDVGNVVVRGSSGEVSFGVCNEFMSANQVTGRDIARIATFPDLIAAMDPDTGDVLAISELKPGTKVVVFATRKRDLPLGSGIFDPAIYPEVERSMDTELARYALDPAA